MTPVKEKIVYLPFCTAKRNAAGYQRHSAVELLSFGFSSRLTGCCNRVRLDPKRAARGECGTEDEEEEDKDVEQSEVQKRARGEDAKTEKYDHQEDKQEERKDSEQNEFEDQDQEDQEEHLVG